MMIEPSETAAAQAQWQQGFALLCWTLQSGPGNDADFNRLAQAITDWEPFIQQLRWHRTGALTWRRLAPYRAQLPDAVGTALQQCRQQITALAMKHSAHVLQLTHLFNAHQIPFIVLKGVSLSLQLYGDPARRFSKDIDILVREADVDAAHQALLGNGFHRTYPGETLPDTVLHHYRQFKKDCTYRHERDGTLLELHWRFDNNPHFLPLQHFNPFDHIEHISLSGVPVPVLTAEHNTLYLIMHAAHSSWARLSWLTDIATLLQKPLDWRWIIDTARALHIEPVVWVTLQLAHRLLQVPVPDVPCRASWRARWVLNGMQQTLQQARYPSNTVRMLLPFLFCNRPTFWLFHLRRNMAISLNDMALLPLPRALFFLYYPLRPFLWGWRRTVGPLDLVSARRVP